MGHFIVSEAHYNYFRDYDPSLGRYVESDPIGVYGGLNTYLYGSAAPFTRVDALGRMDVEFIRSIGSIYVYDDFGQFMFSCKSGNNTTSNSNGPWPMGFNNFSYYKAHPESGANGAYGSHGIFIFQVDGREGMGVHSGRNGPDSKTEGCVRTTDPCMDQLLMLHKQTPITTIMVH